MTAAQQRPQQANPVQGLVVDGKLVLSKDGRYLTIYFADGSRLREHRNRFLSLLGAGFTPETPRPLTDAPQTMTTGFIAKTRMALSKDGNYLMVFFPGGRFVKHVNYLKSILGLAFEPAGKTQVS